MSLSLTADSISDWVSMADLVTHVASVPQGCLHPTVVDAISAVELNLLVFPRACASLEFFALVDLQWMTS